MHKKERMMEIFYRLMKGEEVSIRGLAEEYEVSTKSISRDVGEIKNFLSEGGEVSGYAKLQYSGVSKTYRLEFDGFLLSRELAAIAEVLIGCRAFNKMELLEMVSKLKHFTTYRDRKLLEKMIAKEAYHYHEVRHECQSVTENLWKLAKCISDKKEITITYHKQEGEIVERRIVPAALTFSEYYFYLIAYRCDKDKEEKIPLYYRVDRMTHIVRHNSQTVADMQLDFNEGELKDRIQFMQSGEHRRIRFSYKGLSVQAVLDKIPTARVTDIRDGEMVITAETYGKGINMFLLSQGSMVKVLAPPELVEEMSTEIQKMADQYRDFR